MRWLLLLAFAAAPAAGEMGYAHCGCDGSGGAGGGSGFWSLDNIFKWQKVSDLLIAAAYFSIPLEILYFVAGLRHLLPFRWVLVQFGAFIVLCGLTHLLAAFTYEPHPFMVVLLLTAAKFLTALVSFLTAITLLTLIPQLLRVKVRESLLWIKARELDREVVLMKRQEEASWHVRMLTQEIRRSLDRHTVLYTTLIELSRVLALDNCAVWMPSEDKSGMCLTHELRRGSDDGEAVVGADDADVLEVKGADGVKLLPPGSILGSASGGGKEGTGTVAAIRMPMLRVADFKGGTPQVIKASYAVLVLVPPSGRKWAPHELEIVEVVADQVAVALSHASLLEESQAMRDRLAEQNRELLQARRDALMANEARDAFQRVMSQGMRRPIHSVQGLVSVVQEEEGLASEQRLVVDAVARTATVVSTLINDVMEMSAAASQERFPLETRPFRLRSMVRDAACVARCLCDLSGRFGFAVHVENVLPDLVIGDERRIFHVLLHMVGNLIGRVDEGDVTFRVRADDEATEDQRWDPWRPSYSGGHSSVRFVVGVKRQQNAGDSLPRFLRRPRTHDGLDLRLSFSMCRKLVQTMQGNIWAILDGQGLPESMTLVLRFQLQPSLASSNLLGGSFDREHYSSLPSNQIAGLKVLLIDDDEINLVVARKLLERLGCTVSSGSGLMDSSSACASFQLVMVNLEMSAIDPLDAASRIRQQYRSSHWPLVMAMTSEQNVWEKCAQSGINGVLKKPLVLLEVKEELERILQNT
ncbi:Ethylene receptor 3 [Zea mays]|uniref:Ethylene receptor n=1 Tax=Zea mays TaxID=4577 RepID=A0A3L6F715_MAIZE|nr:Ethylene receptor 3 [Zea mays]